MKRKPRWLRLLLRGVGVVVALGVAGLGAAYLQGRTAIGVAPDGDRLVRMMNSSQWEDGAFRNTLPLDDQMGGAVGELFGASDQVTPAAPVSVVAIDPRRFDTIPSSGLRVTWLGHSTTLVEMDGTTILTDPVWGPRASPLPWMGPERWYDPVLDLEDLPPVDVVVISHDHYDHLDHPTIVAMEDWPVEFVVPLGVGAHLEHWGVPSHRINELDWWDRVMVGEVEVVMTPARHASGRQFFDGNRTLWAGYAFVGPRHRVFFSGDTGMFPEIKDIGDRLGPFDVTMIEVGAYAQSWADWHMGPEQAVEAHRILRGEVLLPIHWGLFNLSTHGWTEPIERVLVASREKGVTVFTPRPGGSFEAGGSSEEDGAYAVMRWWPDLPWRPATEYPVVSSQVGG